MDESFKENSRASSYGFCVRDQVGDLLYAKETVIEDATNLHTEEEANIQKAMHHSQALISKAVIQIDSLSMLKILNQ